MWAKGETKLISIVSNTLNLFFLNVWLKKNYDQNIYVKKFLDIRIFLVNQIFLWTNFLAKKMFLVKKMLVKPNFWSKQIFGQRFVCNFFILRISFMKFYTFVNHITLTSYMSGVLRQVKKKYFLPSRSF